jgi:glycine cleavage system aminomethyltransferase T
MMHNTLEKKVINDEYALKDLSDDYESIRNFVGLLNFDNYTKITLEGDNGEEELNKLATGNIEALQDGNSLYTSFCYENGSILALAWILRYDETFIIISEPEKREVLFEHISSKIDKNVSTIKDKTSEWKCLTLIGPEAQNLTQMLIGDEIIGLPYLGFEKMTVENDDCFVCRIGNTGEYEFRFIHDADILDNLKEKLLDLAQKGAINIRECDTRVLDPVMLEMKSINQLKDITEKTKIVEVGLHWMVDFAKEEFLGKAAIEKLISDEIYMKALLLVFDRSANVKVRADVELPGKGKVGKIQHCEYSFILDRNIAMAFIDSKWAWVGLTYEIQQGNNQPVKAQAMSTPLFETKTTKKSRE